ncbi:hypothetical protein RJ639_047509 [Escallonia herrerae]|uniref:tRNA dimethylallyltransferase 2 n=1 Tax=Escallonia herrerae TaxID=1293975 RepID=A0AA89AZQ6_9ASTE|nr:hypothetical protein RJ639_047509 [Escallonia herrerae]
MDNDIPTINPNNEEPSKDEGTSNPNPKPKVLVIMGATGAGKSRLAVDLASYFPIEIINADSMQVYQGLDVLTNKVPHRDRKGVPHHLLGTISPYVEFTAKDFRDTAVPQFADLSELPTENFETHKGFCEGIHLDLPIVIGIVFVTFPWAAAHLIPYPSTPCKSSIGLIDYLVFYMHLINDIVSHNCIPVIVGGTNYYIQALVSPMLLDDSVKDMDENCPDTGRQLVYKEPDYDLEFGRGAFSCSYDCLKDLDPVAASRIHPNDHRKTNQYLNLYTRSGMLPSKLLQGKTMEAFRILKSNYLALISLLGPWLVVSVILYLTTLLHVAGQNWGRVDNFRYNCCLICVDASLPVLDQYVERRVDCMVAAGLLKEVYHIYSLNADYTRGLRQAIGVREFEDFLREYLSERPNGREKDFVDETDVWISTTMGDDTCTDSKTAILSSHNETRLKLLLTEAINKVKVNTRRLVRRQKRRLNRLQTLFGWDIHYVDATESLLCLSEDTWTADVVGPSVEILRSYFNEDRSLLPDSDPRKLVQRDLWTQYMCKACGNRVLRGTHEWEQHKQGRGHRKRTSRLRKSGIVCDEK